MEYLYDYKIKNRLIYKLKLNGTKIIATDLDSMSSALLELFNEVRGHAITLKRVNELGKLAGKYNRVTMKVIKNGGTLEKQNEDQQAILDEFNKLRMMPKEVMKAAKLIREALGHNSSSTTKNYLTGFVV